MDIDVNEYYDQVLVEVIVEVGFEVFGSLEIIEGNDGEWK